MSFCLVALNQGYGASIWGSAANCGTGHIRVEGFEPVSETEFVFQTALARPLDNHPTQVHSCVMIPPFNEIGLLPPGIHQASWSEFAERYGGTTWRDRLLIGLKAAVDNLRRAGCRTVYVDGSFVTAKEFPNDFDACWEEIGVDPWVLDAALLTFDPGRATQKAKYLGEFFPASSIADANGSPFLEFFQTDKATGRRKGIIAIDLGGLE